MGVEDIQTSIIENNLYDRMILLSDGVTDLLSQEQIKIISTQYPPHLITEELVKAGVCELVEKLEEPKEELKEETVQEPVKEVKEKKTTRRKK